MCINDINITHKFLHACTALLLLYVYVYLNKCIVFLCIEASSVMLHQQNVNLNICIIKIYICADTYSFQVNRIIHEWEHNLPRFYRIAGRYFKNILAHLYIVYLPLLLMLGCIRWIQFYIFLSFIKTFKYYEKSERCAAK